MQILRICAQYLHIFADYVTYGMCVWVCVQVCVCVHARAGLCVNVFVKVGMSLLAYIHVGEGVCIPWHCRP